MKNVEVRGIKRKAVIILRGLLFSFIALGIAGCTTTYDYTTDGPFVISSNYSAGPDDYRNMYPTHISIDHHGNLLLYTSGKNRLTIGDDAPIFKMQLSEEQVNDVKRVIQEQKFWELPEDVSTPSEDGAFSYVTVHLSSQVKKVGGLNPNDPQFLEIRKFISQLIDDDDYRKWKEDIEEHIWERNP